MPRPTAARRPAVVAEIATQLRRREPGIVAVIGSAGVGRTALLAEVNNRLRADDPAADVRLITSADDAELLRDEVIGTAPGTSTSVVVIDDFDTLARLGASPIDRTVIAVVSAARAARIPTIIVLDAGLEAARAEFGASLFEIVLDELPRQAIQEIVAAEADAIAQRHGVTISPTLARRALTVFDDMADDAWAHGARPALPGRAVDLLDQAAARARIAGRSRLHFSDLIGSINTPRLLELHADPARTPAPALIDVELALLDAVHGQDAIVSAVAERCVASMKGLTAHPKRPHGVFLLTGPTGTGKTQLATALAGALYGASDAIIRLDMSEYSDAADARMKLIGASRIWKNSTPDGLLTTRVLARPRSVVVLDEFEKSSPEIWSLFLQIFDEGRLTDGWGQVASFSNTVIVMTSNLGVGERTVESVLAPELLARLDARFEFQPLTDAVLEQISATALAAAARRLSGNGWTLTYDEAVVPWLARTDRDPRYGARHVQRGIERHLLTKLVAFDPGRVHVSVAASGAALTFAAA